MNALQRAQRRKPKCDGCNPPAPNGVGLCGDCLDAANTPAPKCCLCGEELRPYESYDFCAVSDDGNHVAPRET